MNDEELKASFERAVKAQAEPHSYSWLLDQLDKWEFWLLKVPIVIGLGIIGLGFLLSLTGHI